MINAVIALTSIVVALWFAPIGVVECVVGVDVSPYSVSVYVDPVFLVWDEDNSIPGSALTIGNTIVIEERWRGTEQEAYLLHHEMNHVRQCQSLGWAMWPAYWFDVLQIEGHAPMVDWSNPAENDEFMWVPTEDDPNWYHFLTLTMKLGG